MSEPRDSVRVIQFQMATDAVTGGSFQVSSDVPRSATSEEIAAEFALIREAGMQEMAASNRRRLEHARIFREELEKNIVRDREAGKHLKNADLDAARTKNNMEQLELMAQCSADDQMLLNAKPTLGN